MADVDAAEKVFVELGYSYKDVDIQLKECKSKREIYKKIEALDEKRKSLVRQRNSMEIASQFDSLAKEYKALDWETGERYCLERAVSIRSGYYQDALNLLQSATSKYFTEKSATAHETENALNRASKQFNELEGYRDSTLKAQECLDAIESVRHEEARIAIETKKKKLKKSLAIGIPTVLIITVLLLLFVVILPNGHFNKGLSLMQEKQWEAAREEFLRAGNYKGSAEKAKEADYDHGLALMTEQKWDEAKDKFVRAGDFSDAATKAKEADYQKAKQLLAAGDYEEALPIFKSLGEYSDSVTQYNECVYLRATGLLSANDYDGAYKEFIKIQGYRDVNVILRNTVELKTAIGCIITLGTYDGKPIEWRIIAKDGDNAILLSCDILDKMAVRGQRADDSTKFNRGAAVISRAKKICSTAFSDLAMSKVSNITILSKNDIEKYLPNSSDRIAAGGAWWTSTNGTRNGSTEYGPFTYTSDYFAFIVNNTGGIDSRDAAGTFGVRPAITISLSNLKQLVQN